MGIYKTYFEQVLDAPRNRLALFLQCMPIYPACMPIYLTGGERHDLFNRYEPQILRTVWVYNSVYDLLPKMFSK
jgi:hypothetical protein